MLSSLLFVSCASEGLRDFSPDNLRLAITRLYVLPCSGRRYSRLLVLIHLRVLCNCFLNPAIQGKIKAETQLQKLASCLFLRVVAVPCGTESLVENVLTMIWESSENQTSHPVNLFKISKKNRSTRANKAAVFGKKKQNIVTRFYAPV